MPIGNNKAFSDVFHYTYPPDIDDWVAKASNFNPAGAFTRAHYDFFNKVIESESKLELADYKDNAGPGGYERLYINHNGGGFKSSSSGIPTAPAVDGIILGLIKQRRLWMKKDDGANVGCKSPNAEHGYPTEIFPLEKYKYTNPNANFSDIMPFCHACPFARYGSDPRCQEKWYVPILRVDSGTVNSEVSIMEFTQSAIAEIKAYLGQFVDEGESTFNVVTQFTTDSRQKNNSQWEVPVLSRANYHAPRSDQETVAWTALFREARGRLTEDAIRGTIYAPKTAQTARPDFGGFGMGS